MSRTGIERPAAKAVGFGIVGCGPIGRWHAKTLARVPGVRLVAGMDTDPSAAAAFGRSFDVAVHTVLEDLLAIEDVEVVCVCTPPAAQAPAVMAAAAAGKHVLVEKPFACDLDEADRAIAACERAGVQLGVVYQQRARSASRAVHRLLRAGRFGDLTLAVLIHTWWRPEPDEPAGTWRGDPGAGGGVLGDQAVHGLDLLIWMLGPPRWASARLDSRPGGGGEAGRCDARPGRPGPGEHTATAVLGFEGGAVATLAASTATNAMRDDIALELYGTRGGVRLEIRDYDHAEIAWLDVAGADGRARRLGKSEVERIVRAEAGAWRAGPRAWPWRALDRLAGAERGGSPFRSVRGFLRRQLDRRAQRETGELQGHAALLQAMAAAARGDGRPLVTGADARAVLAVIDAIRRSDAAAGRRTEVERGAGVP